MAGQPTPIFPQTIVDATLALVNGTGTTATLLATGGTNGTKLENLTFSSTDTAGHDIQIFKTISAANYLLGTVSVPAGAGNTSSVPSVNALAGGSTTNIPGICVDANGNNYIYLASGTTLLISAVVAVTSGKTITAIASGGNY